jgi:hypothetical protein
MAVCGFALAVHAQGYINGTISFVGGATLNSPSLATASAFTSIFGPGGPADPNPTVLSATGDYASIATGTAAPTTPFTFNPAPASSFLLWTINANGNVYTFSVDANSILVPFQTSSFLDITGTGIASIAGVNNFLATPGTFSITDTGGASPVFTFGAYTEVIGPGIPEPSVVAMLLLGCVPLARAFYARAKRA